MTQVAQAIDVQPQSGWTGAEIHGVDLTKPLDGQQIAEIRADRKSTRLNSSHP